MNKLLRTHPFPESPKSRTLHGVPAPLHLPAIPPDAEAILSRVYEPADISAAKQRDPDAIAKLWVASGLDASNADLPVRATVEDDTIVVDVEVNAAGQIEITGAERGS